MLTKFETMLPAGTYLLGDYTPIVAVIGNIPFPKGDEYGIDGVMVVGFHLPSDEQNAVIKTSFGEFETGGTVCLVPVPTDRLPIDDKAIPAKGLSFTILTLNAPTRVAIGGGDEGLGWFNEKRYVAIGDEVIDIATPVRLVDVTYA